MTNSWCLRACNEFGSIDLGVIYFSLVQFSRSVVSDSLRPHESQHAGPPCPKASILLHSAFFTVQLSHPYVTTGKTIALTRWNFVGKVMSLLFNMLSRLVITVLPRSKHLLFLFYFFFFASFNFMAAVTICSDFGAPQNKVWHCFHCFPSISHEVMGPDAMIFVFWMLSFVLCVFIKLV